jgi:hypothetical protein
MPRTLCISVEVSRAKSKLPRHILPPFVLNLPTDFMLCLKLADLFRCEDYPRFIRRRVQKMYLCVKVVTFGFPGVPRNQHFQIVQRARRSWQGCYSRQFKYDSISTGISIEREHYTLNTLYKRTRMTTPELAFGARGIGNLVARCRLPVGEGKSSSHDRLEKSTHAFISDTVDDME